MTDQYSANNPIQWFTSDTWDEAYSTEDPKRHRWATLDIVFSSAAFLLIVIVFGPKVYRGLCARNRSDEDLEAQDRIIAEQLQLQIEQELQKESRQAKYADRRSWYEMYLKPYTMTATSTDFFYAKEVENRYTTQQVSTTKIDSVSKPISRTSTVCSLEEMEEVGDAEPDVEEVIICEPVIVSDETDEDAHPFVRLPVYDKQGTNKRSVDAECSICFCEYEKGDKIVWSDLKCRHAFHKECILPWLVKGKKRCPVCRHWFVPGAPIANQKKAFEAKRQAEQENLTHSVGLTTEVESQSSSEAETSEVDVAPISCPQTSSHDIENPDLEAGTRSE